LAANQAIGKTGSISAAKTPPRAFSPTQLQGTKRQLYVLTQVLNVRILPFVLGVLSWMSLRTIGVAQEVSVPDSGLNAAIRAALQKPVGPLTEQDLLSLTNLSAGNLTITNVAGLETARNLHILDLDGNAIANFPIAGALTNLTILDLFHNFLTNFVIPNALPNLAIVDLAFNSLAQCTLPPGLQRLNTLFLERNALTNLKLPAGLTQLTQLDLSDNRLVGFTLPSDATNLVSAFFCSNQLTNFSLPSGLTQLAGIDLRTNQLTGLTLPPDLINLTTLLLDGNPLVTLVLSQPLAATSLAGTVATLRAQSVQVFTYPLTIRLTQAQQPLGAFRFWLSGPPGVYSVLCSTNLASWSTLALTDNPLGSVFFTDTSAPLFPQRFYRAKRLQSPPANMVFVPGNTFMLGSPTNEEGHLPDESPQTLVTLSRGFWISKFLVTQGDYLAIVGSNPSQFPGDLSRPVESVSWFAASNYCALVTQRDLAAGRIPAGSHYRLPTEAEWECAARAGTSTRFYYGDDPGLTGLTNHAWFGVNSGLATRPVAQKLPNAWGLFDMEGNVWEWCQDWYGPYSGGAVTDPPGPPFNPLGSKVIRGGAWESSEFDCRSARRSIEPASPFISDFIIGFRIVLVMDP
jgi:formylglycine-generating enzyme required for sulfatase activity